MFIIKNLVACLKLNVVTIFNDGEKRTKALVINRTIVIFIQ